MDSGFENVRLKRGHQGKVILGSLQLHLLQKAEAMFLKMSKAGLTQSLANKNGEDTPLDSTGIPCINFTGADTGLGGGVANLVLPVLQPLTAPISTQLGHVTSDH